MDEGSWYADPRYRTWKAGLAADPRSTAELLAAAPFEGEAAKCLQARADQEVFDGAIRLCRSPVPHEREAGAHLLGELGLGEQAFPDESVAELCRLLHEEPTLAVLATSLVALGHRWHPAAVPHVLPVTHHANEEIRLNAVHALLTQEHPDAVAALIRLSADEDDDVRNWATFGIGTQINVDTREIRAALRARLEEPDHEIRGEALVGLARRGDPSVMEPVIRELSMDGVSYFALEAAEEMGDERLLPYLEKIAEWWDAEPGPLNNALERCRANPRCPRER